MKFSLVGVFFLVVIIAGCSSHNLVVNSVSEIDQRKVIELNVNEACKNNKLFYKPYWDSTLPKGKVVFKFAVKNKVKVVNGKSIDIFIDGKKYSYETIGDTEESKSTYLVTKKYALSPTTTDINETNITYISYLIDYNLLKEIINSKNTGIRINLINKSSIEDVIVEKNVLTKFKEAIDKEI